MDKGDSPWSLMLDIEGVSPQVTALKSCRTPPLLSFQASCRKPIGKHHQAEMPQQGLTPLPRLFLTGNESRPAAVTSLLINCPPGGARM